MPALLTFALLATTFSAVPPVEFLGKALIDGGMTDRSGLRGLSAPAVPQNRFGGWGSAIDHRGPGDTYVVACDRGAGDGIASFKSRLHELTITVHPGETDPVRWTIGKAILLTNEKGANLLGTANMIDADHPADSLRFDPEGVRIMADGTFLVSDEYGPFIDQFNASGQRVRRMPVPARFRCAAPKPTPQEEQAANTSGRQSNRGFEGLALTPSGNRLVALLQSPLIQDGGVDAKGRRIGINIRALSFDTASGKSTEFVYQLKGPADGVSEILALDQTRFLVLERDGKSGHKADHRSLYLIDTAAATDISAIPALPQFDLPPTIKPVTKTELIDFLDPAFTLAGTGMPEKIEGLAFGPDLPDGRKLLIVTVDNDFKLDVPNEIWAFAITPAALAPSATPAAPATNSP